MAWAWAVGQATTAGTTVVNVTVQAPPSSDKGFADYALAIGPSVLAALVAITVVLLGSYLTQQNVRRQFRAQRRSERELFDLQERRRFYAKSLACAANLRLLLYAYVDLQSKPTKLDPEYDPKSALQRSKWMLEAMNETNSLSGECQLVGSQAFIREWYMFVRFAESIIQGRQAGQTLERPEVAPIDDLYESLVLIARDEVGVHVLAADADH